LEPSGCGSAAESQGIDLDDLSAASGGLLERIKLEAHKRDMPYQSLIKAWLAEDVYQHRP